MKQNFYCKECEKEFSVNKKEKYWNYNCPDCHTISRPKNTIGVKFKGLPTLK